MDTPEGFISSRRISLPYDEGLSQRLIHLPCNIHDRLVWDNDVLCISGTDHFLENVHDEIRRYKEMLRSSVQGDNDESQSAVDVDRTLALEDKSMEKTTNSPCERDMINGPSSPSEISVERRAPHPCRTNRDTFLYVKPSYDDDVDLDPSGLFPTDSTGNSLPSIADDSTADTDMADSSPRRHRRAEPLPADGVNDPTEDLQLDLYDVPPLERDYVLPPKKHLHLIPPRDRGSRDTAVFEGDLSDGRPSATPETIYATPSPPPLPRDSFLLYESLYKFKAPENSIYMDMSQTMTFYTIERLVLKTSHGCVLDLRKPVDCIVNPTNATLDHKGGISYTLARKAGPRYQLACSAAVQRHGLYRVSECCATTPGELPCSWVMNVVEPRREDFKDLAKTEIALFQTILNCLNKADSMGLSSIVFPAISTGNFGVSKEVFANQCADAVLEFSRSQTPIERSLREVSFLDVSKDVVKEIQSTFGETFATSSSELFLSDKHSLLSGSHGDGDDLCSSKESKTLTKYSPAVFELNRGLTVLIYTHDIRLVDTDALLCPEDTYYKNGGRAAAAIKQAFRQFCRNTNLEKLRKADGAKQVVMTTCDGHLPRFLLHTAVPVWTTDSKEPAQFEEELRDCYRKILTHVRKKNRSDLRSLALPLLGIDNLCHSPVSKCCSILAEEIRGFYSNAAHVPKHLQQLHLVCQCRMIAEALEGYFRR